VQRVIVVGAGVVGLSCAVRLLEAGHRVDVVARDLPLETTSAVAAAICYPYRAAPPDRVEGWTTRSYAAFEALAGTADTGVRMLEGTEVLTEGRRSLTTPVVEMPIYLGWLAERVLALGGTITRLNLAELPSGGDVVVNCAGLGARLLGGDTSVVPVSGQVVYVEQFGLDRWWLDSGTPEGPTYVIPRSRDIVVGGTDVEGDWSRTPSPEVAEGILTRGARLVPELAGARVIRHKVGLRPVRPEVRLEREGRVVHCYGHGGSGVTLSWGTADEVAELVATPVEGDGGGQAAR
jgi:D-amino-acid oxidase